MAHRAFGLTIPVQHRRGVLYVANVTLGSRVNTDQTECFDRWTWEGDAMSRPCLEPRCTNLTRGTRCPTHQQQHDAQRWAAKGGRYNGDWRRASKQAIANHLATHGPVCPGWRRQAHPVNPTEFVCDHDVGPLCRGCNARKAAIDDKGRGA